MRNMLAFLAMVALTVGGAGWYLGWFQIKNTPSSSGHRAVNIDINTAKIGDDIQRGATKVEKILEKNGSQPAATAQQDMLPMGKDGKPLFNETRDKLIDVTVTNPLH